MSPIKFKIAAKTDVGRVRENNEDNFQAASDLAMLPMRWVNDKECMLGSKGALLVVADGMGGMNAGEVASEIAIDTVRDYFRPENITDEVVRTRYTIERFMKNAIIEADNRIKMTARKRPETHGMGTTIVIAWVFGRHLYVSWCGDSRAYIYNPAYGLRPLTKDHSYVQDLVDRGAISPEDAFDYPDSNIITRSLSDASAKARPDCLLMPHELCDGDVVLLCTDGLNGMIRDEEIEQVVAAHYDNMDRCADALIQAACDASGHDNVTVALCHILSGGSAASCEKLPPNQLPGVRRDPEETEEEAEQPRRRGKWMFGLIGVAICLLVGAAIGFYVGRGAQEPASAAPKDTVPSASQEPASIPAESETTTETETPPAGNEETPAASDPAAATKKKQPARDGNASAEKKKGADQPAQEKAKSPEEKLQTPGENPADPNGLTPIKKEGGDELTPVEDVDTADKPASDQPKEGDDSPRNYKVKPGEGLKKIAEKFGVTEAEIIQLNKISDPDKIQAGQTLQIPRKKE